MASKKKYFSRKFLNPKEGMAAICIEGTKDEGFDIQITDCSRSITLDFWDYTKKELKEDREKKLNLLISELQKAREFFYGTDE